MSPVPSATPDRLRGYSYALVAVVLAVLLRWAFPGILGPTPFLAFYPAVMLAAILGGNGPGVFAALASAACVGMLFDPTPGWEHLSRPAMLIRLGLFLIGGIGTSLAAASIRASRAHARQQAKAVRESDQRFRGTFENAAVGIAHLDHEGRFLRTNQKLREILGRWCDELRGQHFNDLTHPEDREPESSRYAAMMRGEIASYTVEKRYLRPDGQTVWVQVTRSLQRDAAGQPAWSISIVQDITERKRAEVALRQSEQRLRATFNNAALGIVEVTGDDRIIDANERMCQMLGYGREELLGRSIHELTAAEDRQQSDALNAELRAGRRDRVDYEKRYLRRDGTPLWVRVVVTALRDADGRWVGAIGTVEDIQQRKVAEERARQLNRELTLRNADVEAERSRWQGVVEGMAEEVWTCDSQGRMSLLNLGFVTPMNLREFRDRSVAQVLEEVEILNPDGQLRPPEQSPLLRSLRGEVVRGEEIMRHRQSGTTRWRQYSSAPTRDAAGQITGAVAIVRDITEQKQMQESLRESEEQLRLAAQAAEIGMWSWEPGTSNVTVSANWRQLFGVSDDVPVTFETWRNAMHVDDRERAVSELNAASEQHREFNVEYRAVRPDGTIRWIIDRGRAWYDEQGRAVGMAGVNVDITGRKEAEQALRQSEQRVRRKLDVLLAPEGDIGELELADIIDAPAVQALVNEAYKLMHIPMAIIDLQGRVLVGVGWQEICTEFHRRHPETCQYCIESDTQLTIGVAAEEFRLYRCKNSMWDVATPILIGGKHVGNLFTGQFFFDDEQVDREQFRAQARQYGFDEKKYLAALDAAPRLSRDAVQTAMSFFMRLADMLSQLSYSNIKLARSSEALAAAKLSAEQAKHAAEEANRAKDQFLAVLSHELRTPLTPVVTAVSMLQEGMQDEQTARDALEMIRRNVEMEARLIDDLLDVTRIVRGKIELQRQPTMLCEIIRQAAEVCRPDIETRQIHFAVDLGRSAPYLVNADPTRLQQAFWNLLKNAVKFTPHGGCIGIRCRREDGYVIAEVVDSGEGIEAHLLPSIFNPFEQGGSRVTRQFGGLGLGLTITKGVVELHDGTIEAHSEGKGKGATFRIRLPLCVACEPTPTRIPTEAAESQGRVAPAPVRAQRLRILLVEDHGDTARVMSRLLSSRGYEVQTAGDVATALDLAEHEPFDLLLSDLGLPDGSGVDLMRTLRERGRSIPGIALSGYGQEEDVRRSKEAGFAAHLVKPTNPDQLTRAITTVVRPATARYPASPSCPKSAQNFGRA